MGIFCQFSTFWSRIQCFYSDCTCHNFLIQALSMYQITRSCTYKGKGLKSINIFFLFRGLTPVPRAVLNLLILQANLDFPDISPEPSVTEGRGTGFGRNRSKPFSFKWPWITTCLPPLTFSGLPRALLSEAEN